MDEEKNDNDEKDEDAPDEEAPDNERPDDERPEVRIRISPALQAQMAAASKAISNAAALPIQRALRDLVIAQQAPFLDAARKINAMHSAKLAESVQAIGRAYSAPLNEAMKSLADAQMRPIHESLRKMFAGLSPAPKIIEALGRQTAIQFPKIDFTGYQKAFKSPVFFDAKKLLGSFDIGLRKIDPAIFESLRERARVDIDRATAWTEPADDAEPREGIEATLGSIVTEVNDLTEEVRRGGIEQRVRDALNARREILLTLLHILVAVLIAVAGAKCQQPITVQPVIVIEDKTPDAPAIPPAAPSPKPPPSAASGKTAP
ncbi:MAG: hypothetical protein WAT66_14065 [Actinomycetota bacterium]